MSISLLKGLVAVVTGASRGIGKAIATAFAENSVNLALCASGGDAIENVAATLAEAHSVDAFGMTVDVRDPDQIEEFYRTVFKTFKKLDILVNNAGILGDGLVGMIPRETIDDTIATNVKGAIHNIQSAARLMRRNKQGAIVNISSIIGTRGNPGQVVYGTSKAALIGMTYSAAKELAADNIRVNAVAPGYIDTDMIAHLPKDIHAARIESIGLGRVGSPDEVAQGVLFLVSDMSSYITGQVLGIDGGMVI